MPKRTKKLLVYLDQNFTSEMAKADINEKVKPEWKDLYRLLKEGFLDEKLVVPQSWFHDIETSLAPVLKKRIVSYQNYLGQVSLHNADHVRNFQVARFLQRFLGKADEDPLETEIAFHDPPDQRVRRYNITANLDLSQWGYRGQRLQTAAVIEGIRTKIISDKVQYEQQLEREFDDQRVNFLKNAMVYQHLCEDPRRDLVSFSRDPIFETIPVLSIQSRLWARVLTKFPTRKIGEGDATDIDVISTYSPYMDVIGTDAFMATQLVALGIDKEHDIQVFNAKTASLEQFCSFLRIYLNSTLPVNRPTISIFVLPSETVKKNAFKLFFDLGAATREFGEAEYAEIYGFDDGKMPRYLLRSDLEVPFYGLQDVYPIKLEAGTTVEATLKICREHCKSDYFVLIDEYRPINKTFLIGTVMSARVGLQTSDGYHIYPQKT